MFEAFIDRLARTPAPPDAFNPFAYDDKANVESNTIRRANLKTYLERMATLKPTVMLVAEAPGYRGMRLTGVPFSSRYLIIEGVPGVEVYGEKYGYRVPPDAVDGAYKEQTATIVWQTLPTLRTIPVNWNSYPFHPHKPGEPLTNRAPRKPEVELGRDFLLEMLSLFSVNTVIAVGNVAHKALHDIGMDANKVRHPAQGGKNDFVAQITALMGKKSE